MALPKTPGIYRPPCPRGHEGSIQLDGRALTKDRLFERTRFRCVPHDRGEKEHVYRGQMPSRRAGAGHNPVWQAQVRSRTLRGSGCRLCAHKEIAPSEALATTHPIIAAQWHPTRNGTKTPADFSFGSHHEAWWQCPVYKSHVWRARIASRTSMQAGCSLCASMRRTGGIKRADAEAHAIA